MGIIQEFKEFAIKGNVIDMAVGVIIGGAFGKIVTSLVNDIIMPPVGLLMGGVPFKDLFIQLSDAEGINTLDDAVAAGVPVLAYGQFIQVVLDFLIVAISIFAMIKFMNVLRRSEEKKEAEEKTE